MTLGYDIIGDIHGCAEELIVLLRTLGYINRGTEKHSNFYHPERKVVFLGDYIDRGPAIFKTLRIIRTMVEEGNAYALMGNHEYNAILYHTASSEGGFLRSHDENHTRPHRATLEQLKQCGENWEDWIEWFKALPLWLRLPDSAGKAIQAVHACFDPTRMEKLFGMKRDGKPLLEGGIDAPRLTEVGICETAARDTEAFHLLEAILKGPEMRIPGKFRDKDGATRKAIRLRWWEKKTTLGEMAMMRLPLDVDWLINPFVAPDYVPVHLTSPTFVGHYWFDPEDMKPLSPLVACLDSSCVHSGLLTAYRYNQGDGEILTERFVSVSLFDPILPQSI